MLALTKKELNHTKMRQNVTFSEKKVMYKFVKDKNVWKDKNHYYYTGKYRGVFVI